MDYDGALNDDDSTPFDPALSTDWNHNGTNNPQDMDEDGVQLRDKWNRPEPKPPGSSIGGSHPHHANEFAYALAEKRQPFPNAAQSANWTCVGLCAHQSALAGGKIVKLPAFTLA